MFFICIIDTTGPSTCIHETVTVTEAKKFAIENAGSYQYGLAIGDGDGNWDVGQNNEKSCFWPLNKAWNWLFKDSQKTRYRVYEAYKNDGGGIEGVTVGANIRAKTAKEAALMYWDLFEHLNNDENPVIVATDEDSESYHFYPKGE